jgi:4-carboxymuconolactone decarboxylase
MDARTEAVYDVLDELWRVRTVSRPTYLRAVDLFGERGFVDLVAIAGYYSLLAMLMNATRTAAPPGTAETLPILP